MKVYNKVDDSYKPIGKAIFKFKTKNIDLRKFEKIARSKEFIIELSNRAFDKHKGEKVDIYFRKEIRSYVVGHETEIKKYKFHVDFETIIETLATEEKEGIITAEIRFHEKEKSRIRAKVELPYS